MLLQKIDPVKFIATSTLYFTIVNLLKVPIFLWQGLIDVNALVSVLWALPIIPLGVWIGRRALNYISPIVFERIMMVLLVLSIIFLFVTL